MSLQVALHRPLPNHGKRVVLCDRDQTLMLVMKHLLEKLHFSVSVEAQAKKGLGLVESEQPQLLIWGLNKQPDIDFHMLQNVQQYKKRPYVILLSTPETLTDDAPIEVLGSGDVFIKPFEPTHLIRRIKALMQQEKI
jgi:DNA-binding response OmpR family regulator